MSSAEPTTYVTSCSPQDPTDVVEHLPAADPQGVQRSAQKAREALRSWSTTPAVERAAALGNAADALAQHSEDLVDLMVREVGKPRLEASAELKRGVAILKYFAQQALDPVGDVLPANPSQALLYTRRRPRGVAALITPWNFPVAIPLWKAAPALAFGNTVLLKPSPESTGVAHRLSELIADSLPPDTLTLVPGGAESGEALVKSADVVSFTGSVPVGRAVSALATERGIPFQTEMGGLNASIVLPDADVSRTAATVAAAAMGYAGQKCTATSRAIVVGEPGPFTDALVGAVESLAVGDPRRDETVVGPVINEQARRKVLAATSEARTLGGRVLVGGAELDQQGFFVAPTLVDGLPPDAQLLREEVFGPICSVVSAENADEAVTLTNNVTYGLVTSVFTRNVTEALRIVDRLDSGLIRVNAPTSGVDFHAPFGGEKASSAGPREQGKAAQEFYTTLRTITLAPEE